MKNQKIELERRKSMRTEPVKYRVVDKISDLFRTGIKEIDESEASKKFFDLVDGLALIEDRKPKQPYIIGFDDGMIKIGVSSEPSKRINTISLQSGRTIKNLFIGPRLNNAHQMESKLKDLLIDEHVKGEFYETSFNKVFQLLKDLIRKENKYEK
jgi:Meiotically up-regulated gene 113